MEKFSSIEKKKGTTSAPEKIWEGKYMSVVNMEDWEVVSEPDMVIVLPYLIEKAQVVIRYEVIPPYRSKFPMTEKFVTLVSGGIEDGETAEQAIRRELIEECGIKVNDTVKLETMKPLFVSKGNTATYTVCILPLMEDDYDIVRPTGDGSVTEAKSNSMLVPVNSVKNMVTYDLITKYVVDLFEKGYKY